MSLRPALKTLRHCLWLAAFAFGLTSGAGAAIWYVAPNGVDTNAGSSNAPFYTITRAQTAAASNDVVWLRGGTYHLGFTNLTATNSAWAIVNNLTKSGISYLAFTNERPVFDFSGVLPIGYRTTAFLVTGNNNTFKGFDVIGVQITLTNGNVQSECFRVTGSRNRFENLAMHDGMGIGWYLTAGSSNLVLNCDAYNNRGLDSASIGNIDGFGFHPNSTNGTGNTIRGCRAWYNSDDGYDCINAFAPILFENCWAFYNGYFTNNASSGGDANGFKAGGYGISGSAYPTNAIPRHTVRFCLAVKNRASGFYANHHLGGGDWFNNTAYRNGVNFNMLCSTNNSSGTNDEPGFGHVLKNNLGYKGNTEVSNLGTSNDTTFNYFTLAGSVTVASNDFMSLDESLLTAPRRADGSLPYTAFAQPVSTSDVVNAGTNIGFAFVGSAPDLGAFEFGARTNGPLVMVSVSNNLIFTMTNGAIGATNLLLAATNASLPMAQWARVATNKFDVSGSLMLTNIPPPGMPWRYYRMLGP